MRICFVDPCRWDYDVTTPSLRPLGGAQSALCYLAVELAKTGCEVILISGTSRPGAYRGVECLGHNNWTPRFFKSRKPDVVIVLNASQASGLRSILPLSTRLVLWTGHAVDQPAMQALADRETQERWDHIVAVSDWHRQSIIDAFGVNPERISVLRNAIAPVFEGMFASEADLIEAKAGPMRLAYTSTPFRGLDLLPAIFPAVREAHKDATLEVYSSLHVYMDDAWDRQFHDLYATLKATDGVEYVGSVAQPDLAGRLRGAHILAYPNTWPETSCIAVMEAMAAGLRVVTSELGALPETTAGFARLSPTDPAIFVEALLEPHDAAALWRQVEHMNRNCTWAARAREWVVRITE